MLDSVFDLWLDRDMGKFNSLRDEVVYRASGSGCDDEIGSVDDFGWYGLVLDFYGRDYIIHEDSMGFVGVADYPTTFVDSDGVTKRSAEAGNAWCAIYDDSVAFYGEEDE
jgi:hypothetical protein